MTIRCDPPTPRSARVPRPALTLLTAVLLTLIPAASRAAEPDPAATRLTQLEAVARAALALPPRDFMREPSKVPVDELGWGPTTRTVELVMATDLAKLIGAQVTPEDNRIRIGAQWPLEAAAQLRGQPVDLNALGRDLNTPLGAEKEKRAPELLARLRHVVVVFEDEYVDPFGFGQVARPDAEMRFSGRAALYALEGARLLAYAPITASARLGPGGPSPLDIPTLQASSDLGDRARRQIYDLVGITNPPTYGPLMELEPRPLRVSNRLLETLLLVLAGVGLLIGAYTLLGRRRHRLRRVVDGVPFQIMTSDDGARVTLELETALDAPLRWSDTPRDGDVPSGDPVVDRRVCLQGPPLPALFAAFAGAAVWRPIVDMGGRVEGDRERLVIEMSPQLGVDASARRFAELVLALRGMGNGIAPLIALVARDETPHAARARIAIALTRWAPDSPEGSAARDRLGWSDPLEPHLIACLTDPNDSLVADACDALASIGTSAALPALEHVHGPARTAASRAIAAIIARSGDPRRGALALSADDAGALSLPRND